MNNPLAMSIDSVHGDENWVDGEEQAVTPAIDPHYACNLMREKDEVFWDAIGATGIQYPFDDSTFDELGNVKPQDELARIKQRREKYDDRLRHTMIMHIQNKDDAALGRMLRKQAIQFASVSGPYYL